MESAQGVECADGGHHERARDERRHLIVGELDPCPRIEQVGAETVNAQRAVRFDAITHRMLHEGVCHQNEVAGEPASQRDRQRGQEVIARTQSLFAPDERADKGAFQKEREHALHRQRLSDDAAGVFGEARPVGPELKLHRNAGHHPDGEIEPEDLGPESRGPVVLLITCPQGAPLPIDQEPRQAHGQLRKQVVVREGEGELETVPEQCVIHGVLLSKPGVKMPSEPGRRWSTRPSVFIGGSPRLAGLTVQDNVPGLHGVECASCLAIRVAVDSGRAEPEQADEHLVFVVRELIDGAAGGFAQDAVDDGLLQLGRDVWRAEGFHHPGQWIHEVIHEVFDSAIAATQMPLQALTHHAPAKPRSVAHGSISVLDAQHALLDEVEHLAIERRLQAVRDMAGKLLLQVNRLLADRRIERHRRLDRFGRASSFRRPLPRAE